MKKIGRILAVLCLMTVLCIAVVVTATAGTEQIEYTGSVEELSRLVDAVGTASDKVAALSDVCDYLESSPVDPATEGYSELVLAAANEYLSLTDVNNGTASNGVAINRLNAFIKAYPLDESVADYGSFKSGYDQAIDEQNAAIEAQKAALYKVVSVEEYYYEILREMDFGPGSESEELFGFTQLVPTSYVNYMGVETDDDGNGYFTVRYWKDEHTYPRIEIPMYDSGVVFEFDFTTQNMLTVGTVVFEHGSVDGIKVYPSYMYINSEGDIAAMRGNDDANDKIASNGKMLTNAIVPGEWLHFSLVFHPTTGYMDYYINYEYLGSADTRGDYNGQRYNYNISNFRVGVANNGSNNVNGDEYDGEFSIDNLVIYEGSSLRDIHRLETLQTDAERFIFYTDAIVSAQEKEDIKALKAAYDYADALDELFWNGNKENPAYIGETLDNERLQAAVDIFADFDYDKMVDDYKDSNLAEYKRMVAALDNMERTLNNTNDRTQEIETIRKFVESCGEYIRKGVDFDAQAITIAAVEQEIAMDESINLFCQYVTRFYNAYAVNASVVAMQAHYDTCTGLYNQLALSLREEKGYEEFDESCTKYNEAKAILDAEIAIVNAERIVDCVSFILEYDTVEEWEANYDYINKFVLIIRQTVRENNYDKTVEGVADAVAFYEFVDDYFYGRLQAEHVAFIEEQLDRYDAAETYVEMIGICAYVDNYLADESNDIDRSNQAIIGLVNRLGIYKSELDLRRDEYEDVLAQNTVYFINTVKRLMVATSYEDKLKLYDEASVYYFAMNLGEDDVKPYIEAYTDVKSELKLIKESSERFIGSVNIYSAAEGADDKFAALVECYYYSANAEISFDGVAEAMEIFTAAYNAYLRLIGAVNDEIAGVADAVATVRANSGVGPIVSVALKLIFG